MHSEIAIAAAGLTKTYRIFGHPGDRIKQAFTFGRMRLHREFTALKDTSFEIKKGEAVGIIGRNGSGKSTLLQLVCGILKPTAGTVVVNGRMSALLELGAGFNPEFTGRENVYFQGAVMGLTKMEMEARFSEIEAFADIGEFIDQPVRTYSSGMYVRLAFSVAIHVEPDILVVDEALGVGDVVFTQKCFRFLNDFRGKSTLIVVSHDLNAITRLCKKVLWLDQGTVRDFGPAKTVCENYLSAVFGGVPRSLEGLPTEKDIHRVDPRLPFLNASNLRNDLELFSFDPAAPSFGSGGAQVVDVQLTDEAGQAYSWIIGGEDVVLSIQVRTYRALASPIVGFHVKDNLGQPLFGDNTHISYVEDPVATPANSMIKACFQFQMPRLPIGHYSISVAVAEGSQDAHEMQHWIHDALVFQSRRSSVTGVILGLSMHKISLEATPVEGVEETKERT
jgi:lipopolysaccharide transport system ATP-binding protein